MYNICVYSQLQSILISGHSAPDELVIKLMLEKLNSLEVSHFGMFIFIHQWLQSSLQGAYSIYDSKHMEVPSKEQHGIYHSSIPPWHLSFLQHGGQGVANGVEEMQDREGKSPSILPPTYLSLRLKRLTVGSAALECLQGSIPLRSFQNWVQRTKLFHSVSPTTFPRVWI